ncbi:MAG TPA: hypothetical protein VNS52_00085, partial [Gemmatimonadaceae bacterium]|nr:hypothetical protein [Gemmatimonadaceae bacterium]
GILAAIAIPKFASTKEKAYLATMKSDLRNLATAQEGYFADAKTYFSGTASNDGAGATASLGGGYVPSSGVTVTVNTGTGGWSASAGMATTVTSKNCFIFVGMAGPNSVAVSDGEPRCN